MIRRSQLECISDVDLSVLVTLLDRGRIETSGEALRLHRSAVRRLPLIASLDRLVDVGLVGSHPTPEGQSWFIDGDVEMRESRELVECRAGATKLDKERT